MYIVLLCDVFLHVFILLEEGVMREPVGGRRRYYYYSYTHIYTRRKRPGRSR